MFELYAEVIINSDAIEIDRPFTYKVKEELLDIIEVGHRVKVPFGVKNKPTEAFVLGLKCEGIENVKKIKYISSILDDIPILTRDDLRLIDFLRENYLCKYIDAIRTIIPSGLSKGIKNKKKTVIVFNKELDGMFKDKDNYVKIVNLIKEKDGELTKSEIINDYSLSSYSLNKLIENGYLLTEDRVVYRYNTRSYIEESKNVLNDEQKNAFNKILNSDKKGFLLKGVTGSGKTEVYMNLVGETLKEGKSAIVLVPEISLTPQMIERFKGRFGKNVALFHSKLSQGERFDEWYRIKKGEARLVVGARSAIFLPLDNLGIIIIDEEHENTYKSEQNPKYLTKEVAKFLSEIKGCKYILGSATPSIETYYEALNGKLELVEIKNRVSNRPLPQMEIVDMREELKSRNLSLLSRSLYNEMKETLERKEQIILFLNRRGFSSFVSCRSCGYVFKCPECDLSMTYHKNGYLICHYCGRAQREQKVCPECGSKYVKFFGAGTQRVEEEVKKYFPKARVMRMDVDTTRNKDSHENIYNAFKSGEGDVLIGTQMVSKGLDFKNVTLVGVLAADISLNIPDYRSSERTYQIITQVAGRAGRGEKKGKVVIQTYTPNSLSLQYAIENNYNDLYNEEIKVRKIMNYPPFSTIFLINSISKDERKLKEFMNKVGESLRKLLDSRENIQILGPVPCIITKLKDNYRWQIIIKGNLDNKLKLKIKDILYELNKSVYNEIRISMDINPNNMT
ncbi:MAG: primosomal protein N' [Clostridium sp.]|uniref:primosomal protein N' n=2 Tax=Clostridiaceae TaxID=31979 RepID=UPI0006653184|nr:MULTISPECIES: primosomal protein N' [Clostridium]MBS7129664.1 primosomal protein N' [Clostridium sp.]MDB2092162.1 primosomal protein N' [Clostridium paraputrificum]MDB2107009.1 primosomal protein N' [Clostridium paraputrificum]MDB2113064.1 primosomal protein N' [Clostridium paraputrificum]MDB2122099.1 primosomal protein N' [Clostridium paraputrificum]